MATPVCHTIHHKSQHNHNMLTLICCHTDTCLSHHSPQSQHANISLLSHWHGLSQHSQYSHNMLNISLLFQFYSLFSITVSALWITASVLNKFHVLLILHIVRQKYIKYTVSTPRHFCQMSLLRLQVGVKHCTHLGNASGSAQQKGTCCGNWVVATAVDRPSWGDQTILVDSSLCCWKWIECLTKVTLLTAIKRNSPNSWKTVQSIINLCQVQCSSE